MPSDEQSGQVGTENRRSLGEKLYRWSDTENWPVATYKIGVVAYKNLVIVRPPAPFDSSWKWGLDPEVGVAYAKLAQQAIERIREDAEAAADGGLVDQKTVREVTA